MANLQVLVLSDNPLTHLPPEIGQLCNLESLWLDYCPELTELPQEFCNLNVKDLKLKGCRLVRPLYDPLYERPRGIKLIRQWFAEQSMTKEELSRSRRKKALRDSDFAAQENARKSKTKRK